MKVYSTYHVIYFIYLNYIPYHYFLNLIFIICLQWSQLTILQIIYTITFVAYLHQFWYEILFSFPLRFLCRFLFMSPSSYGVNAQGSECFSHDFKYNHIIYCNLFLYSLISISSLVEEAWLKLKAFPKILIMGKIWKQLYYDTIISLCFSSSPRCRYTHIDISRVFFWHILCLLSL